MRDWSALPPHLRNDPDMMAWRQDDHEQRLQDLEQKSGVSKPDAHPTWLEAISLVGTGAVGLVELLQSSGPVAALLKQLWRG